MNIGQNTYKNTKYFCTVDLNNKCCTSIFSSSISSTILKKYGKPTLHFQITKPRTVFTLFKYFHHLINPSKSLPILYVSQTVTMHTKSYMSVFYRKTKCIGRLTIINSLNYSCKCKKVLTSLKECLAGAVIQTGTWQIKIQKVKSNYSGMLQVPLAGSIPQFIE